MQGTACLSGDTCPMFLSLPFCSAFILNITFMHSGEGVQNHDRHAVWSVREVRERAHANSQKACQMSVRCRGGLSRGGGACPMCRLSDGEERGTAQ